MRLLGVRGDTRRRLAFALLLGIVAWSGSSVGALAAGQDTAAPVPAAFEVPRPDFGAVAPELRGTPVETTPRTAGGPQEPPQQPKPGESQQAAPPPSPAEPKQTPPPPEPVEMPVVSERSPEHTGFKALVRDTGGDFLHLPSRDTALWLAIGGGLALAVHPIDDDVNSHLQGSGWNAFFAPGAIIGLGYVQIGAAIGTWAVGLAVDKRGRAAHLGLDLLRAQIVTQSITYGLKYAAHRERPDGSDGYSFPSGHASTTFATATVLERHLGWKAALPTYLVASYVAASRLHENRHYLSDVVFGATVGLVSGRTVTRHGRHNYALVPLAVPDGVGVAITRLAD